MPDILSDQQVRDARLHAQHLVLDRETHAAPTRDVVRWVTGIQAQDLRAAALSIRARRPGTPRDAVDRALVEERSIVRTWLMRGTLHLATAADVHWLLAALGARFVATSRRRREQLGLDDETATRGARLLEDVLQERGPLTRAEIRSEPVLNDVPLEGQAAPHLLRYAALEGRICYGPTRDGAPTYVALEDWIGRRDAPSERAAQIALARRYLRAFGPATPADMAQWSGLTLTRARALFEDLGDELVEVRVDGHPAWMLEAEGPARGPLARLLPKYDTLLLGYRSRDWILPPEHATHIYPGGGLLRRSVLAGGRIVGTWDPQPRGGDVVEICVRLFEEISPAAREQLSSDAADVGRFLGGTGVLEIA